MLVALRTVIYARLSKTEKKKQTVESIEAQIADCMTWANDDSRHPSVVYEVVAVFQDNITASRFSTKDRPDFVRMMQLIRAGKVDAVLVTEQSRLDRQTWNVIDLIKLALETPFREIVKVRRNEITDPSTETGVIRTVDQALRDREESTQISERVRAKKLRQAVAGEFPGGRRPFGWEADGVTPIEREQELIRWAADQILAGASLSSLTRSLNKRLQNGDGLPTAFGGQWQRSTLQFIFRNKRIIGIRVHHGVEHKAQWNAVIPREQWDRIQLRLDANQSRRNSQIKGGRTYLLTGYLVCGTCDNYMTGSGHTRRGKLERRYYCRPEYSPGIPRGCGKVSRLADPIEALVTRAVLFRLDSEGFAQTFANATQDTEMQTALAEHQETKTQLAKVVADYYREKDKYVQDALAQFRGELQARLAQIAQRMERIESSRILTGVPFGEKVTELWNDADQGVQRNLIGLLLHKIVIQPSGRVGLTRWTDDVTGHSWLFDPSKVELHWKV
jgi:site-specific DNA recombinase